MSRQILGWFAALWLGGLALGGCPSYVVHTSTQPGQVYVVDTNGSDKVYSCDARNGRPICYRVHEIKRR